MLFRLLEDICLEIDAIDRSEALAKFARQLKLMKPDLPASLFPDPATEQLDWATQRLAEAYISLIKDIPRYVEMLSNAARDPHMEGGYRAAILGSLAYLVQPRDLIPDDLPGGFGFIDDCLLLHVTTCECMAYLPRDTSSERREVLLANFLALTIPNQRLVVFREAAEGIRHLIFHIGLMDPKQLTGCIEALERDPLAPGQSADPASYRASSAPPGPSYFCDARERSVSDDGHITFAFDEGKITLFGSEVETD